MSKLNWDALTEEELNIVLKKADAGEQWRCPMEIEGTYCALDCISTLQLFDLVFEPVMNKHKMLWDYHEGPFIRTIQELIDQTIRGVNTDTAKLKELQIEYEGIISSYEDEFYSIETVKPLLEKWRDAKIADVKVPSKYKKDGDISKNYTNYISKIEKMRLDSQYLFNQGSDNQMRWLLYDNLFEHKEEIIEYNKRQIKCYRLQSPRGEILLPATKAGDRPLDKHATPWLGEVGRIKGKQDKYKTSLTTFIKPYIKFSETSIDGRMHPGWKVPQAVTGRLGGYSPNFQQITGDKRVRECIKADPGFVIVERDWKALEDYVAANITQCKGLLALYGPDAKENDGHLWLGSQLPVIGDKIRQYYDRDNPTPESIALAKKHCGKERDISKAVKYSATYGIGAFSLYQDLIAEGIDITLDTTASVLKGYWDVFKGMKDHKYKLKREWERNRGWIKNAIGRPMSVGDHHLKDLFSRCVQGGGHDLQMMFGENIAKALEKSHIEAYPFIYDLHDAAYYQVREEHLEDYIELSTQAAEDVWKYCRDELQWNCKLSVSVAYGRDLKEFKD